MCAAAQRAWAGTEIAHVAPISTGCSPNSLFVFARFFARFLSAARELKKQSDWGLSDANCKL
jgi:hypothetical protein